MLLINWKDTEIYYSPYLPIFRLPEGIGQNGQLIFSSSNKEEVTQAFQFLLSHSIDFEKEVLPRIVAEECKKAEQEVETVSKLRLMTRIQNRSRELNASPYTSSILNLIDKYKAQKLIDEGFDLIAKKLEPPGWKVEAAPKSQLNPLIECLVGEYVQEDFDETRRALWSLAESFGMTIQFVEEV